MKGLCHQAWLPIDSTLLICARVMPTYVWCCFLLATGAVEHVLAPVFLCLLMHIFANMWVHVSPRFLNVDGVLIVEGLRIIEH